MNYLEFNELQAGDKVMFVLEPYLIPDVEGSGVVLERRDWSSYPVVLQWYDLDGNKYIEQFNFDSFKEIHHA